MTGKGVDICARVFNFSLCCVRGTGTLVLVGACLESLRSKIWEKSSTHACIMWTHEYALLAHTHADTCRVYDYEDPLILCIVAMGSY